MGVDVWYLLLVVVDKILAQVASFGDFFAEKNGQVKSSTNAETGLPGATSGNVMHLPRGNVTVLPLRPKVLLKRSPIEIPSQESTRSIVTFVLRLSQAAFP